MNISKAYLRIRMGLGAILVASLALLGACGKPDVSSATPTEQPLEIYPDYSSVTVPVNIAPLNFQIAEPLEAEDFFTQIGMAGSEPEIEVRGRGVRMPIDKWHSLLSRAAGNDIYFRIYSRQQGKWVRHADITNHVSTDSINPYLVYRLIYPGYELWRHIGIYQRNLTNFDQTPILENQDFNNNCVNCHSFAHNDPNKMMIHVRGNYGGTLVSQNGTVKKHKPRHPDLPNNATYPTWHPDGRFIAFSTNDVMQTFHTSGRKPIEVVDMSADLMVYDVETATPYTAPQVSSPDYCETFPVWCPGTNEIYFCRSQKYDGVDQIKHMRYNLCRVEFNRDSLSWGEPEVVYDAAADSASVSFPRFSPDGRYLMFTRSSYGNFSIWHPESQLMLLDTATGEMRELCEVNSDDVDSYHTWNSDGRWFVFSSKRLDGLTARPFFASFDPATGRATKPFVLPQENPLFYDEFSLSFNIPELITGPVTNKNALLDAILTQ